MPVVAGSPQGQRQSAPGTAHERNAASSTEKTFFRLQTIDKSIKKHYQLTHGSFQRPLWKIARAICSRIDETRQIPLVITKSRSQEAAHKRGKVFVLEFTILAEFFAAALTLHQPSGLGKN
jgi:hypothetical protein